MYRNSNFVIILSLKNEKNTLKSRILKGQAISKANYGAPKKN